MILYYLTLWRERGELELLNTLGTLNTKSTQNLGSGTAVVFFHQ